ncbi:DUF1707 SHOCT-like domain-containing protein [Umezawaea beigongshangensis]|uniref:DUF1707 SHOCT-like domain-containing protein n=1 Tax=Umezawaea beigongshangensis TaxID=2780383 RepID=UPI0027DB52A3|nr:DUF1707 domain-containing protein [Umezawaea beigongshangensis]
MNDDVVPADPNRMRASDADREVVAAVLHRAAAEGRLDLNELDERLAVLYAAKTYGELVPITSDLVLPATAGVPAAAPASDRIGGVPGPSVSLAFMSGVDRKNNWVVPAQHTAVAVMGGVKLDLTKARFAEAETTITVFTFWGGIEILVPDDITVQVSGLGLLGGFEDRTSGNALPGAPVVKITGLAIMAGVEVRHPKRKKLKRADADD